MSKSQRSMLIAAFFFMVIGFAAVATTLTINGTVKFTANNDNFGDGVIFTSASSNKGNASISQDGKTIDFETESLSMLNETAVLNYTISNLSTMYDAEATLECVYRDTNNAYNNYIQFSLDKDEYELPSGGSVNGSLTTQLKQVTTDAHQIGIRCTIVANAVERNSLGTINQSDTTTLSGVLYDDNGEILPNTVIAVYSEKQVIVTDNKGFFIATNLEVGTHEIFIMSGYTEEQVEAMSKNDIESNSTVSARFTTSVNDKIDLTNDNNDEYTIIIKEEDVDVVASGYEENVDENYHEITVTSTTPNALIEYSTDNVTWTTTNPTYKDIGEYTVYYKVSAPGYATVIGSEKVIITILKINIDSLYTKWIYLDANNGNDETGDGSKSNPYKTLNKITEDDIITAGDTYGIILSNGTYSLTDDIFRINYSGNIGIIGNKDNTIISATDFPYVSGGNGSKTYTISFYRLKWDGNNNNSRSRGNTFWINNALEFYNVTFDNIPDSIYSYFGAGRGLKMVNCTLKTIATAMLRKTTYAYQLTNCYGPFTSGYGTQQSDWDYQTNRILTSNPTLTSDYKITESESLWKDAGTGTDPDGSQADLGVYGGQFSWDYDLRINN